MARKASGYDQVAAAQGLMRKAKTADELRTAQAVLLPLEMGLSLAQTAQVIGRCVKATTNMRTRFCRVQRKEQAAPRSKRELRNRAHASLEREAQILDEVLAGAMEGEIVIVPPLKDKVAEKLGKEISVSTFYRMLARNGWRKLMPNRMHPKGKPEVRNDWKKTPRQLGRDLSKLE